MVPGGISCVSPKCCCMVMTRVCGSSTPGKRFCRNCYIVPMCACDLQLTSLLAAYMLPYTWQALLQQHVALFMACMLAAPACCITSLHSWHAEKQHSSSSSYHSSSSNKSSAAGLPQFPPMMYRLWPTRCAACSYRGGGCFASDCMGSTQDPVALIVCTACCKLVAC